MSYFSSAAGRLSSIRVALADNRDVLCLVGGGGGVGRDGDRDDVVGGRFV